MLDAFTQIHGHANGLGHENDGALCQEFLTGTEYVIDGVSRDGVYKVRKKIFFVVIFFHTKISFNIFSIVEDYNARVSVVMLSLSF